MLLKEVLNPNSEKLVALSTYIADRATDTGSKRKVDINAFLQMAQNLGISLTADQLRDIAGQEPLSNIIANVTNDEVILKGAGEGDTVSDKMTVKQAQDTVEKMAKRAAN